MIGKRLGNRYKIERRLGVGGMAVVFLATDVVLDRHVAIKVLNESLSGDEDFVDRFRREARAAARLSHPNVVNIYDVGEDEGIHYIVMEYIEGETLKARIKREGALPVREVVHISEQIADALQHAHENGIVHRDIKSHNMMIGPQDRVKVADFGIARATSAQTITHTGSVMGSVHYFSPEQARGGHIGEKSDLYSLGVVTYEMATGELPFSGESPISVALKHLQEDAPEPKEKRHDLPQSVDNIIRRAMAKDPLVRYETAQDMQDDLKTVLKPSRLSEPRWEPEDPDEEATMVVPALDASQKPPSSPQAEAGSLTGHGDLTVSENHERANGELSAQSVELSRAKHKKMRKSNGSAKASTSRWKKPAFAVFTVLLIVALSVLGLDFIWSLMSQDGTTVPEVVGMSLEQAEAALKKRGLNLEPIQQKNEAEAGTVFRQSPKESESVKRGRTVQVFVSTGQEQIQLPNMINSPVEEAKSALYALGIKPGDVVVKQSDDEQFEPGHVVSQTPNADAQIAPGDTVTLFVRPMKELVEVPDLIGEYQDSAEEELRKLGFEVHRRGEKGAIYSKEVDVPLYKVFDMTPKPGESIEKGSLVQLHVSLNESYGQEDNEDDEKEDDESKHTEEGQKEQGKGNKGNRETNGNGKGHGNH